MGEINKQQTEPSRGEQTVNMNHSVMRSCHCGYRATLEKHSGPPTDTTKINTAGGLQPLSIQCHTHWTGPVCVVKVL